MGNGEFGDYCKLNLAKFLYLMPIKPVMMALSAAPIPAYLTLVSMRFLENVQNLNILGVVGRMLKTENPPILLWFALNKN